MDKYTASNGIQIAVREFSGELQVDFTREMPWTYREKFDALREFFRAEEDERLGRWRWPENPDYVVYIRGTERWAWVLHEPDGVAVGFSPDSSNFLDHKTAGRAARAYFDAHPEAKYTTTEWVAKAMYEGQAGVPWEEARDEDRDFWLGSAADAIAKYEEVR